MGWMIATLVLGVGVLVACAEILMLRKEREANMRVANEYMDRVGEVRETAEYKVELIRNHMQIVEQDRDRWYKRAMDLEEEITELRSEHEKRADELNRQIQNMAERVASLRQEGLSEGGDDFHVEKSEPKKPYSTELQNFISGLENQGLREQAHDLVEMYRDHGIDDEQIVDKLEERWSA